MSTSPVTPESFSSKEFDFIVVGGGTAGLALASRLSEDPSVLVGVIEAGEWDPNVAAINIPGLGGSLIGNPKYDWGFTSVPQKHANNRPVYQPRGKALGGSSMLNFLTNDRASAREYDAIEALGNPGWNWEEFLKYIKKSEATVPLTPEIRETNSFALHDPHWHGDSGPIVKAYPTILSPLHEAYIESLEALGVPKNPEPYNGNNVGTTTSYATVDPRAGKRSYAANGYYEPVADRPNLVVLTGTLVAAVTFQAGTSPLVATGVKYVNGGKTYKVTARKEVILSAGSFQTPQLLELSGIGNKEILAKHGIETLLDLPSDHVFVLAIYEIDSKYNTLDVLQDPVEAARQQELYKQQKGYLASAAGTLFSFVPAKTLMDEEQKQTWNKLAEEAVREAPESIKKQLRLQIDWFADPTSAEGEFIPFPGFFPGPGLKPEPNARYSSIISAIMHPLSRGSVHISSADPAAPPVIDPNYFSNPADLQLLLAVLKFALKVYQTPPYSSAVRKQIAPSVEEAASDEALCEYIKNTCGPVFHPLGTASMLPKEDGGVVDPSLKVYGTANLRVVDASIIPIQLSAHTQATIYAIAEKAADIIKGAV